MARVFSLSINPNRLSNDLPVSKVPQLFLKNLPENFYKLSYGARRSYTPFKMMATSLQPQCSKSATYFCNTQPSKGSLQDGFTACILVFLSEKPKFYVFFLIVSEFFVTIPLFMVEVMEIWRNADAVCFDVDSTVCLHEGIDELADFCGAGKAVSEWTNRLDPL